MSASVFSIRGGRGKRDQHCEACSEMVNIVTQTAVVYPNFVAASSIKMRVYTYLCNTCYELSREYEKINETGDNYITSEDLELVKYAVLQSIKEPGCE